MAMGRPQSPFAAAPGPGGVPGQPGPQMPSSGLPGAPGSMPGQAGSVMPPNGQMQPHKPVDVSSLLPPPMGHGQPSLPPTGGAIPKPMPMGTKPGIQSPFAAAMPGAGGAARPGGWR